MHLLSIFPLLLGLLPLLIQPQPQMLRRIRFRHRRQHILRSTLANIHEHIRIRKAFNALALLLLRVLLRLNLLLSLYRQGLSSSRNAFDLCWCVAAIVILENLFVGDVDDSIIVKT